MIRHVPTWITVVLATGAAAVPACSSDVIATASGAGGGIGGIGETSGSTGGSTSTASSGGGGACPGPAKGAGGGPTSPLRIVDASVISGTEIRLVFGEAVKPPTGVDASDFRLSAGQVLKPGTPSYTVSNPSTASYDPNYQPPPPYSICPISDGDYGDECSRHPDGPRCTQTLYRDMGAFSKLEQMDDTQIVATLEAPLGAVGFKFLPCGGLFLHYTAGSAPIEDTAGHPLEAIAPAWVHTKKTVLTVAGDAPLHPVVVGQAILGMYCASKGCSDGLLDGNEIDVDCGDIYTCPACGLGKHCVDPYGCQSHACVGGVCANPSCTDQQLNGTETDVDCGGAGCPPCANGKACSVPSDCQSQHCSSNGVCTP